MPDDIYFQWQNEALKNTIYPLREQKLRDFLVYYQEIDLWTEYEEKAVAGSELAAEMAAMQAEKEQQRTAEYEQFQRGLSYFRSGSDRAEIEESKELVDQRALETIANQYQIFSDSFSVSRSYVLNRLKSALEAERLRIMKEIASTEQTIRNVPNHTRIKDIKDQLAGLLKARDVIDEELERKVYPFIAIFKRVEDDLKHIANLVKEKEEQRKKSDSDLRRLSYLLKVRKDEKQLQEYRIEYAGLEEKQRRLDAEVEQLKDALSDPSPQAMRLALDRRGSNGQQQTARKTDVVNWKVEQYKTALQTKDHQALLEEIVRRFLDDPKRYPLWLQYMVIHFSGMRYKSAHGSWGDPRDLLLALRMHEIGAKKHFDNVADIEAQSLRELNVEEMTDQEALDALRSLKDQLPKWMWKQIVERTELRTTEVSSEDWEELSAEEKAEYLERESAVFREIMRKWKQDHLTGWRREHDRANRLIVSRAVCNEVAEHIQHLRGHTPPGGLTAKPEWYIREHKAGRLNRGADRAIFVKPEHHGNFKEGASILWLRWVTGGKPNPWRIAHPLTLPDDSGLLPAGWISSGAARVLKQASKRLARLVNASTDWVYEISGDGFRRKRIVIQNAEGATRTQSRAKKAKKERKDRREQARGKKNRGGGRTTASRKAARLAPVEQENWLRWMHEATVAEVAQTANGPVVLTFETALPDEDPRRSTIGVFRHDARNLTYRESKSNFNGSFVGYLPQAEMPLEDMKEMLDWNKILRREDAVSAEEMEAYWQQVTAIVPLENKVGAGTSAATTDGQAPTKAEPDFLVEVAPRYSRFGHQEYAVCYELATRRGKPIRQVHKPRIELRRGLQLRVSLQDKEKIGSETYHRITSCEAEPRAVGFYISVVNPEAFERDNRFYQRAVDCFALPKGQPASLPFVSEATEKGKIGLRQVRSTNAKSKPKAQDSRKRMLGGVKLRVSAVQHHRNDHRSKALGKVNGIIDTDGKDDYYLIVRCPRFPSFEGMWIKTRDVEPITETEYAADSPAMVNAAEDAKPKMVKVIPKDQGRTTVRLFTLVSGEGRAKRPDKKNANFVRAKLELDKEDGPLTVGPPETDDSGLSCHKIVTSPSKPDVVGLYIRSKEVEEVEEGLPASPAAVAPAGRPVSSPR